MELSSYRYGIFEKWWLRLESRSMDSKSEQILQIIPVVLFMQKDKLATLLDSLQDILKPYLKAHLIQRIFDYTILKLKAFSKNEYLFMNERDKAFDVLVQDIQLYALVVDLCSVGESKNEAVLESIESVVRKKFDKEHTLNKKSKRLLFFQEKYKDNANGTKPKKK